MDCIQEIYSKNINLARIFVIGDIIYDQFFFGEASSLSQEASVPIFKAKTTEFRLGGAANVFNNVLSLGGKAQLCGMIGDDLEGKNIMQNLVNQNNKQEFILINKDRPTTKKIRFIAEGKHLLRVDEEIIDKINTKNEIKMYNIIKRNIDTFNLLVISDYNKGFLSETFTRKVIELFNSKGKYVIVDSKCNFDKYKGVYLFKPNIKEVADYVGDKNILSDFNLLIYHGINLLEKNKFKYLYITMGEQGGVLFGKNNVVKRIPAFLTVNIDVTGAGDVFLAAIAVAIGVKASITQAVDFASFVSGVSVSKIGTSMVTKDELLNNF